MIAAIFVNSHLEGSGVFHGTQTQMEACMAKAGELGFQVGPVLQNVKKAKTGIDARRDSALSAEIEMLIETRGADGIVVPGLDHLTRNMAELERLVARMGKQRMALISLREGLDTSTEIGQAMLRLVTLFSDWWRSSLNPPRTETAKMGRVQVWLKPEPGVPYGMRMWSGRLEPNASEQTVVHRILHLRERIGLSFQMIADILNRDDIAARNGEKWTRQAVSRIFYDNRSKLPRLKKAA